MGLNRQGHFQVIGMVIGDSEFPGDGVRLSFKEVVSVCEYDVLIFDMYFKSVIWLQFCCNCSS